MRAFLFGDASCSHSPPFTSPVETTFPPPHPFPHPNTLPNSQVRRNAKKRAKKAKKDKYFFINCTIITKRMRNEKKMQHTTRTRKHTHTHTHTNTHTQTHTHKHTNTHTHTAIQITGKKKKHRRGRPHHPPPPHPSSALTPLHTIRHPSLPFFIQLFNEGTEGRQGDSGARGGGRAKDQGAKTIILLLW